MVKLQLERVGPGYYLCEQITPSHGNRIKNILNFYTPVSLVFISCQKPRRGKSCITVAGRVCTIQCPVLDMTLSTRAENTDFKHTFCHSKFLFCIFSIEAHLSEV